MKINDAINGMFKIRICFGEFLGTEKENAWISVRELSRDEVEEIRRLKDDNDGLQDFIEKKFPEIVKGHNFQREDGSEAGLHEVIGVIRSSISLYNYVLRNMTNSPFAKATASNAGKSQ